MRNSWVCLKLKEFIGHAAISLIVVQAKSISKELCRKQEKVI